MISQKQIEWVVEAATDAWHSTKQIQAMYDTDEYIAQEIVTYLIVNGVEVE